MLKILLQRPLVAALFKNSAWILADKAIRILVGMFITAKMARMLGADGFGIIHYSLSVASIFAVLGSLGLENPLNRDISRHPEKTNSLMNSALTLKILGSLAGLLAASIFTVLTVSSDLQIPVLIAVSALFFMALDVTEVYFHSKLQSSIVVLVRSTLFILVSIARIYFLNQEASVHVFLVLNVIEVAVGSLILFFLFESQHRWILRPQWKLPEAKNLIRQSIPLIIFGIAAAYLARADTLFIEKVMGSKSIGIYSVAVKMTEIFYIIPIALVGSSLPALSQAWIKDSKIFEKRSNELLFGLCLMGWTLAVLVNLSSSWIVGLLFGPEYTESVNILRIYTLALPFSFCGSVRNTIWIAKGETLKIAIATTAACVVTSFLYWALESSDLRDYAVVFVLSSMLSNWIITGFLDFKLFAQTSRNLFLIPSKVANKFARVPVHSGPS